MSCTVQGPKSSQVDSKFRKLRLTDASFPGEFSLRSARLTRNECKNPLVGFQNCIWAHERRCCTAGSRSLQLKVSSLKIAPATKYIISSPLAAPCVPCSTHRNQGDALSIHSRHAPKTKALGGTHRELCSFIMTSISKALGGAHGDFTIPRHTQKTNEPPCGSCAETQLF